MTPSRREFLKCCASGAAAWATLGLVPGEFLVSRSDAATLPPEKLREFAAFALERAKKEGATYADVRINRYRSQVVTLRSQTDFATGKLNHVPAVSDSETFGFGIRVLSGGAWGFSAS
ncbi:MAG: PmbA/TldA family metallopeptidase, partial [Thermoanaerobaculia bacterium]